jgi:hypothetical protein
MSKINIMKVEIKASIFQILLIIKLTAKKHHNYQPFYNSNTLLTANTKNNAYF